MKLYPYSVSFPGHLIPLLIIRIASRLGFHEYAWNVGDHMQCDCGICLAERLYRDSRACKPIKCCPGKCGADMKHATTTIAIPQH